MIAHCILLGSSPSPSFLLLHILISIKLKWFFETEVGRISCGLVECLAEIELVYSKLSIAPSVIGKASITRSLLIVCHNTFTEIIFLLQFQFQSSVQFHGGIAAVQMSQNELKKKRVQRQFVVDCQFRIRSKTTMPLDIIQYECINEFIKATPDSFCCCDSIDLNPMGKKCIFSEKKLNSFYSNSTQSTSIDCLALARVKLNKYIAL